MDSEEFDTNGDIIIKDKDGTKMCGYLEKKGRLGVTGRWRRWYCVLDGNLLLQYKSQSEYLSLSPCTGSINMALAKSITSKDKLEIHIITRSQIIVLKAIDEDSQSKWTLMFTEAMKAHNASMTLHSTKQIASKGSTFTKNNALKRSTSLNIKPNSLYDETTLTKSLLTNRFSNLSSVISYIDEEAEDSNEEDKTAVNGVRNTVEDKSKLNSSRNTELIKNVICTNTNNNENKIPSKEIFVTSNDELTKNIEENAEAIKDSKEKVKSELNKIKQDQSTKYNLKLKDSKTDDGVSDVDKLHSDMNEDLNNKKYINKLITNEFKLLNIKVKDRINILESIFSQEPNKEEIKINVHQSNTNEGSNEINNNNECTKRNKHKEVYEALRDYKEQRILNRLVNNPDKSKENCNKTDNELEREENVKYLQDYLQTYIENNYEVMNKQKNLNKKIKINNNKYNRKHISNILSNKTDVHDDNTNTNNNHVNVRSETKKTLIEKTVSFENVPNEIIDVTTVQCSIDVEEDDGLYDTQEVCEDFDENSQEIEQDYELCNEIQQKQFDDNCEECKKERKLLAHYNNTKSNKCLECIKEKEYEANLFYNKYKNKYDNVQFTKKSNIPIKRRNSELVCKNLKLKYETEKLLLNYRRVKSKDQIKQHKFKRYSDELLHCSYLDEQLRRKLPELGHPNNYKINRSRSVLLSNEVLFDYELVNQNRKHSMGELSKHNNSMVQIPMRCSEKYDTDTCQNKKSTIKECVDKSDRNCCTPQGRIQLKDCDCDIMNGTDIKSKRFESKQTKKCDRIEENNQSKPFTCSPTRILRESLPYYLHETLCSNDNLKPDLEKSIVNSLFKSKEIDTKVKVTSKNEEDKISTPPVFKCWPPQTSQEIILRTETPSQMNNEDEMIIQKHIKNIMNQRDVPKTERIGRVSNQVNMFESENRNKMNKDSIVLKDDHVVNGRTSKLEPVPSNSERGNRDINKNVRKNIDVYSVVQKNKNEVKVADEIDRKCKTLETDTRDELDHIENIPKNKNKARKLFSFNFNKKKTNLDRPKSAQDITFCTEQTNSLPKNLNEKQKLNRPMSLSNESLVTKDKYSFLQKFNLRKNEGYMKRSSTSLQKLNENFKQYHDKVNTTESNLVKMKSVSLDDFCLQRNLKNTLIRNRSFLHNINETGCVPRKSMNNALEQHKFVKSVETKRKEATQQANIEQEKKVKRSKSFIQNFLPLKMKSTKKRMEEVTNKFVRKEQTNAKHRNMVDQKRMDRSKMPLPEVPIEIPDTEYNQDGIYEELDLFSSPEISLLNEEPHPPPLPIKLKVGKSDDFTMNRSTSCESRNSSQESQISSGYCTKNHSPNAEYFIEQSSDPTMYDVPRCIKPQYSEFYLKEEEEEEELPEENVEDKRIEERDPQSTRILWDYVDSLEANHRMRMMGSSYQCDPDSLETSSCCSSLLEEQLLEDEETSKEREEKKYSISPDSLMPSKSIRYIKQ